MHPRAVSRFLAFAPSFRKRTPVSPASAAKPARQAATNGTLRRLAALAGAWRLFAAIALIVFASSRNAAAAGLQITSTTLPNGYVGSAYSAMLTATGGSGTGYTWSISAGALPSGLSLAGDAIAGKPKTVGAGNFTVTVTDSAKNSASLKLSIDVHPALAVGTKGLPTGFIGIAYSAKLAATGGTGTGYKWSITAGALPNGLSLTAATGAIAGKPTTAGSSKLAFKVTDSLAHTATAALTIAVNADLSIATSKLALGYADSPYGAKLAAMGGSGTGYSWSILNGSLPGGLTLSAAGLIGGTPTAAGTSSFSAQVKDSAANTAIAKLAITIAPGLSITSAQMLPVGYVGTSYSATLTATGGTGTGYKWSATGTPQNVGLSGAGVLSGSPAAAGTSSIDVVITDSASNVAKATLTLLVDPALTTCTNDQEGTALVELHGVYTFSLNRFDLTSNQRYFSVGSFNADGLGNIADGVMDSNGPEYPAEVQDTFTGTYTVGSDGRGRMDMVVPPVAVGGSTETYTFCFALDSFDKKTGLSARAAMIEDDNTNNVSAGELHHQTLSLALLSFKGTWVVGLAGRKHNSAAGKPDFRHTAAGVITLDGMGNVSSGEIDQNKDGLAPGGTLGNLYTAKTPVAGTYAIPTPSSGTPTGRGTLHVGGAGGYQNFVFYPWGDNNMVILEIDNADPASGTGAPALIGAGVRRSASSSGLILSGSSVRSQYFAANVGAKNESGGVGIDVAVWDGKGNFTYSGDMSANGTATSTSGSGTYTVDNNGRFAVMQAGVCSPCGYLFKTNAGFAIYDSTEAPFELLENQFVPIGGPFELSSFQGGYSAGTRWFVFPYQQTVSGEVISKGDGTITGTLDENQQGNTMVDQSIVDSETSTPTSGAHGRFLLYSNETSTNSAFYIVTPNEALSIPISGGGGQTQPLTQYFHQ